MYDFGIMPLELMRERLSGVRQKVKRAEQHIRDFKTGLDSYIDARPYDIRIDVEADPLNPIVEIIRADPIPPDLRCVLGDAIHNLRAALDHLACALVRAKDGIVSPHTEFPILDDPITTTKREARFQDKVQGMGKEAIDAIRAIHPYHGGNDALWRLHRLDITDKHNMLVMAWGSITAINGLPPISDQWNGDRWVSVPGIPLTLEKGQKFRIPGAEVHKDTKFFAEIVFNEPNVAEGYPVVLGLAHFRAAVMKVVGNLQMFLL